MLSLRAASARFDRPDRRVNRRTLAAAADASIVSCERDARGKPRFDPDVLERELDELPTCHEEGCERQVLGPSGYCAEHATIGAVDRSLRAARKPADDRDYWTFDECLHLADALPWLTLDRAVRRGDLVDKRIGHCRTITKTTFDRWLAAWSDEHAAYFAYCDEHGLDRTAGKSKSAYADDVAREHGRLTTEELRKELGLRDQSPATRRVRLGQLDHTAVKVYGATFFQYDPDDVRDFKRAHWMRAQQDGRIMASLDPKKVVSIQAKRIERLATVLGSHQAAEAAVRADAKARREAYSGTGSGRKRSNYKAEWLLLFVTTYEELVADARSAGLKPPSIRAVAEAVAELDWQQNRERWSRDKWPTQADDAEALDPRFATAAGDRFRKAIADFPAVKALQNTGKKSEAA